MSVRIEESKEWRRSDCTDLAIDLCTGVFVNCRTSLDAQIAIHHHNAEVATLSEAIAVFLEFWNAWKEHHYDPSVGSLHRLNLAERACMGKAPTVKADEIAADSLATEGREIISRRSYSVGDPTIGVSFNGNPPQPHDMLRPGEMVVIYGIPGSARREGGSDGQ